MSGNKVNKKASQKDGLDREIDGQKYYLCCSGCAVDFDKNPDDFTSGDSGKYEHSGSEHHDHGSHTNHMSMPGMAQMFLKKFYIVTVLLIPLFVFSEMGMEILSYNDFSFRKWLVAGVGLVIFWMARIFFEHARHEISSKQYGMMTLVSLGVGAGFLFSFAATFISALEVEFYLEVGTLVWVLMFGHYLEAKSSSAAGDAVEEVAKLLPKQARLISGSKIIMTDIVQLSVGDKVLVRPGEKVPADGTIKKGSASFDESHISGESRPIRKKVGDEVVAGAICFNSSVELVLNRVGSESSVGQIQKLIAQAQSTKPSVQRVADKASRVLTFAALSVALLALLIWTLILGETLVFAITLAITVLVIACPHALGLAIPTVTTIATKLSVDNGIFIKDLSKLEVLKSANYVVFDKTGTLTEGNFGVTDIALADLMPQKVRGLKPDNEAKEFLTIISAIESLSSHVIADSVVNFVKQFKVKKSKVTNVKNLAGKGISASVKNKKYLVGSPGLMRESGLFTKQAENLQENLASQAKTVIYVASEQKIIGALALADQVRADSRQAVRSLQKMGVKVAILTGDNQKVASAVAGELGVDTFFAEVLPKDKYKHVKDLQDAGNTVVMVGDGVNDAPALTQADVGVAIGAGTDVAVEAGDAVLTRDNPGDVAKLIRLSRKVYSKMVQNLIWATGYNVLAIPAAAGAFFSLGFILSPGWGALLMSMSSVIVVANSLTLRRLRLS